MMSNVKVDISKIRDITQKQREAIAEDKAKKELTETARLRSAKRDEAIHMIRMLPSMIEHAAINGEDRIKLRVVYEDLINDGRNKASTILCMKNQITPSRAGKWLGTYPRIVSRWLHRNGFEVFLAKSEDRSEYSLWIVW
ncbi:hypothetical protein M1432_02300 [Patescibacteria group bacterium]|nr:hypothetical protein [Patescibacteria group bacterium]